MPTRVRRLGRAEPRWHGYDAADLSGSPRLLESLRFTGAAWATLPQVTGNGQDAIRLAAEADMAGIICKRLDAPYPCGQRSRTWLKIKFP